MTSINKRIGKKKKGGEQKQKGRHEGASRTHTQHVHGARAKDKRNTSMKKKDKKGARKGNHEGEERSKRHEGDVTLLAPALVPPLPVLQCAARRSQGTHPQQGSMQTQTHGRKTAGRQKKRKRKRKSRKKKRRRAQRRR
jgi:hypothetical protein